MASKLRLQFHLYGSDKVRFEKHCKDREEKHSVIAREIINNYYKTVNTKYNG